MDAQGSAMSQFEESRLEAENAAADSLVSDSGPMVHISQPMYESADMDELVDLWNEDNGYSKEYRPKYLDPADDPNRPKSAKAAAELDSEPDQDEIAESLLGEQEQAEDEGQVPEETEPEIQDLQFESTQDLIAHYQLADPNAAVEMVMELTNGEAQSSPENIDAEAMSNTLTEVALSSALAYDQLSAQIGDNILALPPVPPEQAQRFASEFLSSWGYDPATVPHDPNILANVVFRGAYNQIRAWEQAGRPEDISGLNEPEASQMFMAGLLAAFGQNVSPEQIDAQHAIAFCDSAARVILGSVSKSISLANQRRANPVRQGMRSYQQWNAKV